MMLQLSVGCHSNPSRCLASTPTSMSSLRGIHCHRDLHPLTSLKALQIESMSSSHRQHAEPRVIYDCLHVARSFAHLKSMPMKPCKSCLETNGLLCQGLAVILDLVQHSTMDMFS